MCCVFLKFCGNNGCEGYQNRKWNQTCKIRNGYWVTKGFPTANWLLCSWLGLHSWFQFMCKLNCIARTNCVWCFLIATVWTATIEIHLLLVVRLVTVLTQKYKAWNCTYPEIQSWTLYLPRNTELWTVLTPKYKNWNCTYPEIQSLELYLPRNSKLGTVLTQKYKAWNCSYPEIRSLELYLPRNTKLGTVPRNTKLEPRT